MSVVRPLVSDVDGTEGVGKTPAGGSPGARGAGSGVAGPSAPLSSPTLSRRAAAKFRVPSDETVELIVQPGAADFWMTAGGIGGFICIPFVASWLMDLSAGDWFAAGTVLAFTLAAALLGSMFGLVAYAGGPTLVATDRGIRMPGGKLIPWEDILSIEPTFPYVAEYRIELREGAPALEELREPSWLRRVWARATKRHRIVGSDRVWDLRSRSLGGLEDALDRFVLRRWADEVAERDGAASDDEAGPVDGADLDEDAESDESTHAHEDER